MSLNTIPQPSTRIFSPLAGGPVEGPRAVGQELAYWPSDETAAEPDVEILNALRPAMATIPNSMLLVASTPMLGRVSCGRPTAVTMVRMAILAWSGSAAPAS